MAKASKKMSDPLLDVYNAIKRKMHRQRTAHVFICKYDLEQVWADRPLSQIFPSYKSEDWEDIRGNYICVLSILVYIGWTDMSRFRPLFLREVGRDDANLPFTDLTFLGTSGHMFSLHQHEFKPVIIEERNERYIQNIPTEHRLPFIHDPEFMGNGSYGSVTKRVIATRCLRNEENNKDNPEPEPVACKVYKTEVPFQNYQNFEQEVGNLDFIKESLTESKRVMKHIAAIVHGDEFMIILPLASLYNLEIFLRGGFEPADFGTDDLKPIYDFDVTFPMLDTSVKLQHAVVEEAHQLASALKWLHEDLTIFGSSNRYLAHMDLKPANILLIGDPRLPAGKWMLSDFGVSAFDKATNAKVSDTPSIGDVGHKFTSRGLQDRIVRGHGPYQPPEVDLEGVDNRKCDVWSLCCVLCDILAFAIGKTKAVRELRESRYGPDDDYFYETNSPTGEKIKEIDESNTKLKSQIVEWWHRLERSSASSSARWVIDYIKVLRKALRPKPSDRAGIREIVRGLNELAPSIIAQANESLAKSSLLAPSVPQTKGLASEKISEPPDRRPSITISHEPSQQTYKRNDFRNAAPTDGNPVRASPAITMDHVTPAAEPSPAPKAEESAQNDSEANTVDGPTTTQSVHSIYQATLENLVVLSVRRDHPQIARSASRLKVWGAGLFKMSIPLDVVFESDKDGCRLLRSCILKIFVEILVWEEQELNILAGEAVNEERFRDQQRAQATTALLGSDALIGFALESWNNLLERQADDQTSPAVSRTGGDLVPDLVQILFDLLPALRAARQTYCIRLAEISAHPETIAEGQVDVSTAVVIPSRDSVESKRDKLATKKGKDVRLYSPIRLAEISARPETIAEGQVDVSTAVVIPSRDSVESKLDAVGEILSKRDKLATKKGKDVRLYSPIFRKERERLREFYTSQNSQSSMTNRNTKQLEWKQTELAATLSEYLEQSAGKADTQLFEDRKNWRLAFARARSEKSRDKDKKNLIRQEEEGRIDELIDSLRNNTTDMWSIAGAR